MKKIIDFIHHIFIPHEHNNFRAKALHSDFLTYYLIFALFLVFSFKGLAPHLTNILGYATDISINKLYELTNLEREKYQLPLLSYSESLAQAASKKAQDMFTKNYWSHYGPNGETPWDFILSNNYQYEFAGENLAKNFLFSQGVVDAWMNSPTHKENIIRKDYTEVGFAIVNGVLNGEETTLVVQMFGKPIKSKVKQPVNNELSGQKSATAPIKQTYQPIVLAKQSVKPKINLFYFSFDIIYVFIFFIIVALIADFYIASKMNIIRIQGKNIAHLVFLFFILLGVMLIIQRGSII